MGDNSRFLDKPFAITSVCRQDIAGTEEFTEEDVLKLDDHDMKRIASKLADAYCDSGFWIDLPIIVEGVIESNKEDCRREEGLNESKRNDCAS